MSLTLKELNKKFYVPKYKHNGKYMVHEKAPHLGECPLSIERLIPDKKTITVEYEFCDCCDRPMFELQFCEKCIQMTNHLLGECQKCKKK